MDFLKKSAIFLSIIAVAAAYGDEAAVKPPQVVYNSPARIETLHSWGITTDIRFNYWQPIQENMELGLLDSGVISNNTVSGLTTTAVKTKESLRELNMRFKYKPGFTVGIGYNFDYDSWDLRLAYTWFHNTQKKRVTAPNFLLLDSTSQNISPTWGSVTTSELDVNFQTASEKWKLGMDIIDLDLGRWFYVGSKLTFHPSFGVRAAFIRQKIDVAYIFGFTNYTVNVPGLLGSGSLIEDKEVFCTSHSWAVGPKAALESDWLLGAGFRFFGGAEVDVLYTRYTSLKEDTVTAGTVFGNINFIPFSFTSNDATDGSQRNVDCLRTHLDLELGFGWGSYVNSDRLYIDCSAGYEFQVFFDQNMFRHNILDPGRFKPNGNLYIQGLTVKAKLDF